MNENIKRIACQGAAGAFSHMAAEEIFPGKEILFFPTFDAALDAVGAGDAGAAVIPVENSAAGRVADVHRLLPETGLFIAGEHFVRIEHHLLGLPGAKAGNIKTARSHPQALSQCRKTLAVMGIVPETAVNTAMAAQEILKRGDVCAGAVASAKAAELYGLEILKHNIEDSSANTTRFWIVSKTPARNVDKNRAVTSFVFRVKNLPAVLYKCLGGFATNGIDLLRLESYVDPEHFLTSAGFLVDIAAHPDTEAFRRAFEELSFFAENIKILGTYSPSSFRVRFRNTQE